MLLNILLIYVVGTKDNFEQKCDITIIKMVIESACVCVCVLRFPETKET